MTELLWLIPLIPFLGFVLNGLGRNLFPKAIYGIIGTGAVFIAFILSAFLFQEIWSLQKAGQSAAITQHLFDWFSVGNFKVSLSFLVDPLSAAMLLIITGIGFLIHLYSYSYMHEDKGLGKFCLFEPLCIFHAFIGNGIQLLGHVYWLGRCWFMFLLIDWFLVYELFLCFSSEKGFRHEPNWRFGLFDCYVFLSLNISGH